MTSEVPDSARPGDVLTPDGKILCRDRQLHAFGYFSVTYEQAQIARAYGWGCRAGVFLESEHSDEKSWAYAEDERRCAIENGEEPPLVRIDREAPAACPLDTPLSCRLTAGGPRSSRVSGRSRLLALTLILRSREGRRRIGQPPRRLGPGVPAVSERPRRSVATRPAASASGTG
jgi:hypothetical protein